MSPATLSLPPSLSLTFLPTPPFFVPYCLSLSSPSLPHSLHPTLPPSHSLSLPPPSFPSSLFLSPSLSLSMRFRNKRDDVKALKATLKELQDIDPLDYLAKYCIIDQEKVPHYQRCACNNTAVSSVTVCQIWSISLSARSGLFHCLPDLVYFTVSQILSMIWYISHLPDLQSQ